MLNKKLLLEQFATNNHPQEIVNYLRVVKALLLSYGKKLSFSFFLNGLKKIDADLVKMIDLLSQAKLLNITKLSSLIREIELILPSEQSEFHLSSNEKEIIAPLTSYLEEKFGKVAVTFKPLQSENLSVEMKGQGYVYKRSLNRDLDALLA